MTMVPWTHIMIHHSLTKDSGTVSWNDIRHFHIKTQGWNDIGYHAGIELIDEATDSAEAAYEIFLGRPLTHYGAHCYQEGMNRKAIGFMFCGNFDVEKPSNEMLVKACKYFIRPMMEIFNIKDENIVGHNKYYKEKSCPGKLWDWQRFFAALHQV